MFALLVQLLLSCRVFFALHFSRNSAFPKPLSAQEEAACFRQLHNKNPQLHRQAKDKLVLHNLRLVAHVIKKYYTAGESQEDLLSIGTIGLLKSIDSFCPDKQIRFATYAAKCIENEILMQFRTHKKTAQDVYIQDAVELDKDGNTITLVEKVADQGDLQKEAEGRFMATGLRKAVTSCLDGREREVITWRYGLDGGEEMTQREVAKKLNISRSYVSRLETKALEKLRTQMGLIRREKGE